MIFHAMQLTVKIPNLKDYTHVMDTNRKIRCPRINLIMMYTALRREIIKCC